MNREQVKELLDKHGFDLEELLNNDLVINKEKLIEEGILEFNLEKLLEQGYVINELGEIIPPLFTQKDLADQIGWDRRKVSVYRGRKYNIIPKPSFIISSGPYWTKKQIEKLKQNLKENE